MVGLENFERVGDMTQSRAGLQPLRHRQRRAHLVRDRGANVLHAGLVDLDDLGKQRDALLAAGLRIGCERALGGGHGLVDIGLGAERNLIHRFFGRRIDDGRGLLDGGIDPGAIDVELHAVDHREPRYFCRRMKGTERFRKHPCTKAPGNEPATRGAALRLMRHIRSVMWGKQGRLSSPLSRPGRSAAHLSYPRMRGPITADANCNARSGARAPDAAQRVALA